jgi:hypothetical protein
MEKAIFRTRFQMAYICLIGLVICPPIYYKVRQLLRVQSP